MNLPRKPVKTLATEVGEQVDRIIRLERRVEQLHQELASRLAEHAEPAGQHYQNEARALLATATDHLAGARADVIEAASRLMAANERRYHHART